MPLTAEQAAHAAMSAIQTRRYCEVTGVACREPAYQCGCFLLLWRTIDRLTQETEESPDVA